MKKSEICAYLLEVKSLLPMGGSLRRQMMKSLSAQLEEFVREEPSADRAALEKRFGSPRQIAGAYVEEMETGELLGHLRFRRRILRAVVAAVLAALILWAGAVSAALCREIRSGDGQCVRVVTELS